MKNSTSRIRPAAVSGMFYAADPQQLSAEILHFLAQQPVSESTPPKAIIAPHAGYIYSGPVAASAYNLFVGKAQKIKQVILLGPSHRVAFRGVATTQADYFETPLGNIKINHSLSALAQSLPFVSHYEAAHQDEHSLEVQLPFLQTVLDDFELTPLVVGDCDAQDVAQLLELLWGDEHTLIVISSDLSHYHSYQSAIDLDTQTSRSIEHLQPEKIHYEDACGRNPLNGLLTIAKQKNLHVKTLDLRNSGDTAGDKNKVVGYGAYAIY